MENSYLVKLDSNPEGGNVIRPIPGADGYFSTGQSKVSMDRIDLSALSSALFPTPKVVEQPKLTIEQQCEAARSRLRVSIEAECSWALKHIRSDFEAARQAIRDRVYLDHLYLDRDSAIRRSRFRLLSLPLWIRLYGTGGRENSVDIRDVGGQSSLSDNMLTLHHDWSPGGKVQAEGRVLRMNVSKARKPANVEGGTEFTYTTSLRTFPPVVDI